MDLVLKERWMNRVRGTEVTKKEKYVLSCTLKEPNT